MSFIKKSSLLVFVSLIVVGIVFLLAWRNTAGSMSYADLKTVLTTTTATFGTLLGIITAGLMFTQGKFIELASELSEKSLTYLAEMLPLEKIQSIGTPLLAMRKTFTELETTTTVAEEKKLYRKITTKASLMFVDFAVLLNFKLKQQGLPDTGLLISEMDPQLYNEYQKKRKDVKKEWQVLAIMRQIVDVWEAPRAFSMEKSETESALQVDLKSAITILELKEKIDKSSRSIHSEVTETMNDLRDEIGRISKQIHEDRMPQLLSQMEHASTIRGKYFYLALLFIATPLFLNLLILPQLSEATMTYFTQAIAITSLLSVLGVIFLLLYIHKILNP